MSPILILPETRAWHGNLESFQEYLQTSEKVSRFKRDCIARLIASQTDRRLAERQLNVGLQFFNKIHRDPTPHAIDPLFVERCVADLEDTLRYVGERAWPELYRLVQDFKHVARATLGIRLCAALAASSNSNGLSN